MIHLKVFQRLGYFIPLAEVPAAIRERIAQQAGIAREPTLADLKRFEASGSRMALFATLRRHLNVKSLDPAGHAWLGVVADTAAETKQAVADIINVMLEELVHHRYELPAFSTLDRMAFRAREKSNSRYFSAIAGQLTAQTRALIDGLLKTAPGECVTWNRPVPRRARQPRPHDVGGSQDQRRQKQKGWELAWTGDGGGHRHKYCMNRRGIYLAPAAPLIL